MKLIDIDKLMKDIKQRIEIMGTADGELELGMALTDIEILLENQPTPMEWHKITKRELTKEEKEEYGKTTGYIVEGLPNYDKEVLVTNGNTIWVDSFNEDDDGVYLSGTDDCATDVKAWMPILPYKESEEN